MILKIHLPEGQNFCIKQREEACCRSFSHSSLINKNIYIIYMLNKQNNNFERASHVFVHFFAVFARPRRENP